MKFLSLEDKWLKIKLKKIALEYQIDENFCFKVNTETFPFYLRIWNIGHLGPTRSLI